MDLAADFFNQSNALLRKNLILQKRNFLPLFSLIFFPIVLLFLFFLIPTAVNKELDKSSSRPIPHPQEWPALLHIPASRYRAVKTTSSPFMDLPQESCRSTGLCPVTLLLTGKDKSFGLGLTDKMFPKVSTLNSSEVEHSLANMVLGSETAPPYFYFLHPTSFPDLPIYHLQRNQCAPNSTFFIPLRKVQREIRCVRALCLWRNSSSEVNDELFKGYREGNLEKKINEFAAAFDFSNSNKTNFNVTIWYNSTHELARLVNLASNAYLLSLKDGGTKVLLDFMKGMPQPSSNPPRLDVASAFGVLSFTWVVMQFFPMVLTSLVQEKESNLRIMMKIHGLDDRLYWVISYTYFVLEFVIYMLCLVAFASVLGLQFFTMNDFKIQFLFYFIGINLQISMAFLMAPILSNVKMITVITFALLFGSRLSGKSVFEFFLEDTTLSRHWIIVMELYPAFSLYRGIYELAQYSLMGSATGTQGMQWRDLSDPENGMRDVCIIMMVEWLVVLFIAYDIDQQRISSRNGVTARVLLFLQNIWKRSRNGVKRRILCLMLGIWKKSNLKSQKFSAVSPQVENIDVFEEMTGITKPTSGKAFIEGLDIESQIKEIYTRIGYCPQIDLLWETLTGREHLQFYGRVKNLVGPALTQAVENSLRRVNLVRGGVGDKEVSEYSRSEKRRLSVAISLIGNPQVVFMEEPTVGLDPVLRTSLWNAIKHAKQDRTIILTTQSMEEAEALCDRIGVLADGCLQCIASPRELKARFERFEESSTFKDTTPPCQKDELRRLFGLPTSSGSVEK
ncbi:ABC transporter A family member 10 isoform X3 [Vitis vinifera]|uniref:ABC transporter A family member 10 isoform X3 n=1 Tax=Vitis vinifera TaxID=29760 RepID=UPI00053F7510|nr:ABC transporter A family member 10 isoform X3 [Vitis vinifera]|eukprot:XP_010665306.1 PREDICTED: ABC transporter A family member 10 isoform X3 [Vitis vinifera]